jgi:hypothetical protein
LRLRQLSPCQLGFGAFQHGFLREIADGQAHNPILPRFRTYNLLSRPYHLVVRINIRPVRWKRRIRLQNCDQAFAGGTGNGIDGEREASRFVSPLGADISRIVSRSLFDVPVNNVGPAFSARGS